MSEMLYPGFVEFIADENTFIPVKEKPQAVEFESDGSISMDLDLSELSFVIPSAELAAHGENLSDEQLPTTVLYQLRNKVKKTYVTGWKNAQSLPLLTADELAENYIYELPNNRVLDKVYGTILGHLRFNIHQESGFRAYYYHHTPISTHIDRENKSLIVKAEGKYDSFSDEIIPPLESGESVQDIKSIFWPGDKKYGVAVTRIFKEGIDTDDYFVVIKNESQMPRYTIFNNIHVVRLSASKEEMEVLTNWIEQYKSTHRTITPEVFKTLSYLSSVLYYRSEPGEAYIPPSFDREGLPFNVDSRNKVIKLRFEQKNHALDRLKKLMTQLDNRDFEFLDTLGITHYRSVMEAIDKMTGSESHTIMARLSAKIKVAILKIQDTSTLRVQQDLSLWFKNQREWIHAVKIRINSQWEKETLQPLIVSIRDKWKEYCSDLKDEGEELGVHVKLENLIDTLDKMSYKIKKDIESLEYIEIFQNKETISKLNDKQEFISALIRYFLNDQSWDKLLYPEYYSLHRNFFTRFKRNRTIRKRNIFKQKYRNAIVDMLYSIMDDLEQDSLSSN